MNYLTDSEILEWNTLIDNLNISVFPSYNDKNDYPNIVFNQTTSYYNYNNISNSRYIESNHIEHSYDIIIHHNISFSILESGKDMFLKIKDDMFSRHILNKVITKDKPENINLDDLILKLKEQNILFKNKNYIKYNYYIEGKTSAVMTYHSLINRTLKFFNQAWGINSSKEEGLLLKFKIGDIVTTKNNTIDMIVTDYTYNLYNNKIEYLAEDIFEYDSYIIYTNKKTYSENSLNLSRNNKIQTLLES